MPHARIITIAVAFAVATGLGVLWRRRNGRFRAVHETPAPEQTADALGPDAPLLAVLGWTAGTPLTLLQFSSAFCAPCRATRMLCEQVAHAIAGVAHVEVDAESHLDAVRALHILRTPTVLLVDANGHVVRRASGAPTKAQLLAAVATVLPATDSLSTLSE